MNEPTQELEAYFAGDASQEQLSVVERWINADDANARALIKQLHFRELVGQHLREQSNHSALALVELARAEDLAEPMTVTLHDASDWAGPTLSSKQWHGAVSYLITRGLTRVRVAALLAAALLFVGVILMVVFMGDTRSLQSPPTASSADGLNGDHAGLSHVSPITAPTLAAALVSETDAVWDRRPSTHIYAGERFLLNEGFVQIELTRGASVLIEGPCAFEVTDSNAMRVTHGRLVAQVPPQARLFTVTTPTAEVVDFGTEFGVDVIADGDTEVAVFQGLVELHEQGHDLTQAPQRIALRSGQAARVDAIQGLDTSVKTFRPESQGVYVRAIEDAKRPEVLYARSVMRLKPIAYWPMQGQHALNSVTLPTDGIDLTAVGEKVLKLEAGPPHFESSQAIAVDGERTFYTAGPYEADLWEDQAYSIALWVRIDEHADQNILSFVTSIQERSQHYSNQIKVQASGQLQHYTFCPGVLNPQLDQFSAVRAISAKPVQTQVWMHVAATYGNGESRLYVDGQRVAQENAKYAFETGYPTLLIGGSTTLDRPGDVAADFKGAACQLALFNRVLALKEIQSLASIQFSETD